MQRQVLGAISCCYSRQGVYQYRRNSKIQCTCLCFTEKMLTSKKWQHVDEAERSSVQEKKIRVVYLPELGAQKAPATSLTKAAYNSEPVRSVLPPSVFVNLPV